MIAWYLQCGTMRKGSFRRQKTGLFIENGTQELVSRAQSLHQEVALSIPDHPHRLRYR